MNTDGIQSLIVGWLVMAAIVAFAILIVIAFGEPLDIARVP